MDKKKISTVLIAVVLTASIGTTAWATTQDSSTSAQGTGAAQKQDFKRGPGKNMPELTDEQKAAMEAKKTEMQAAQMAKEDAWTNMTDDQKNSIYSLQQQIADLQNQLTDQYSEYGLIDSDTATKIKEDTTKRVADMKENGKLPMLGVMGGGHGFDGPGRPDKDPTDSTAASTTDTQAADTSGT